MGYPGKIIAEFDYFNDTFIEKLFVIIGDTHELKIVTKYNLNLFYATTLDNFNTISEFNYKFDIAFMCDKNTFYRTKDGTEIYEAICFYDYYYVLKHENKDGFFHLFVEHEDNLTKDNTLLNFNIIDKL